MRAFLSRLIVIVFAATALAAPANAAPSYQSLLAQLKGGDTSIDFQALRYTYTETSDYNPYGQDGNANEAFKALRSGEVDKALELANEILAHNYTSIGAHIVVFQVYTRRAEAAKAAFHKAVVDGLRESIAHSGDGKSPATAYVVIAVYEEYAFLGMAGLNVTGQALLQSEAGPVDAMSVVDETQTPSTVHFNVSRPFAWMTRRLTPQGAQ